MTLLLAKSIRTRGPEEVALVVNCGTFFLRVLSGGAPGTLYNMLPRFTVVVVVVELT